MATVCLVACVHQKTTGRCRAKDLYISSLFRKARQVAETEFDRWYILSAKHGLVHPDACIAPYNVTLRNMTRSERARWTERVLEDLQRCTSARDKITFFAGAKYSESLAEKLRRRGHRVRLPLQGLRIGEQLRWFGHRIVHKR